MEYADLIIKQIFNNFDFGFMFIINVLSYLVIRFVYGFNKGKYVTTSSKRFILIACILVIAVIYRLGKYDTNIVIINSSILATVFWDWILRPILVKLGIDYKQFEKYDDSVNTTIETPDTTITVQTKDKQ